MSQDEHYTRMQAIALIGIKEVLDVAEVAILLRVSESRIRHLVMDREIPHYKKNNGKVTFRKSEIEQWRLGTRVPTAEEIRNKAVTYTAINRR